jgi:hypothetical protein
VGRCYIPGPLSMVRCMPNLDPSTTQRSSPSELPKSGPRIHLSLEDLNLALKECGGDRRKERSFLRSYLKRSDVMENSTPDEFVALAQVLRRCGLYHEGQRMKSAVVDQLLQNFYTATNCPEALVAVGHILPQLKTLPSKIELTCPGTLKLHFGSERVSFYGYEPAQGRPKAPGFSDVSEGVIEPRDIRDLCFLRQAQGAPITDSVLVSGSKTPPLEPRHGWEVQGFRLVSVKEADWQARQSRGRETPAHKTSIGRRVSGALTRLFDF